MDDAGDPTDETTGADAPTPGAPQVSGGGSPTSGDGPATGSSGAAPADDVVRPRGVSFADEDADWKHVDHGPRPEVPNHGARPFLMGVPILLITIAAIVAIVISQRGKDGKKGASSGGPDTPAADVSAAQKALTAGAQTIAGLADPSVVASSTCTGTDQAGFYDCTYGAGAKGGRTLRIEYKDGVLSKQLGGATPPSAAAGTDPVAALLVADDALAGQKTKYACATSTPLNPDGSSAGGAGSGHLCIQTPIGGGLADDSAPQRYVQLAADGTATRDFAIGGQ